MEKNKLNKLIGFYRAENYGAFGEYRDIYYPAGFTPENSNVVITDIDTLNLGTCAYSLSADKTQFKGVRPSGVMSEHNTAQFIFIRN